MYQDLQNFLTFPIKAVIVIGYGGSSTTQVIMHKIPNGTNVIFQSFREG